ncbi:RimK family protein [Methylonatrum kenyense]|uniref:RimK family protein n=1 Tax=Methylonatrum kenyense TaxID=455253 RepID=UPI0020BE5EBE|nr:RimK family protein [Methylonatrum kenyense]MCK8515539.1 RimK family protein [Methylonatrum kenyense]
MPDTLIVVEDRRDWRPYHVSEQLVTADEYLFGKQLDAMAGTRVINLCRSYKYLSLGYYCSLLAEARGHRVIPTVRTINDLSHRAMYRLETEDLDALLQRELERAGAPRDNRFILDCFFGQHPDPALADLARQFFEALSAPLLRIEFRHQDRWRLHSVRSLPLHRLAAEQEGLFAAALEQFSRNVWRQRRRRRRYRYGMAILHNPQERLPPSNPRALRKFVRVGRRLGLDTELITRRDFPRLGEYDALLLRETTAISDHTYRFAKKAESEGLVVMDDPESILRCTNKVYLAELLRTSQLPTPAGRILHRGRPEDLQAAAEFLGFPLVLKIPDGSFSRGVIRVEQQADLTQSAAALFRQSDLIVAQEYLYTDYDWRIGILDRKPLFACQYFMSRGHWQIVEHGAGGRVKEGGARTLATAEAPRSVIQLAVKAAGLIGDGLYGVDIKQTGNRQVVIEVNDNPNIDAGIEDAWLGDDLYRLILESFLRRLERR